MSPPSFPGRAGLAVLLAVLAVLAAACWPAPAGAQAAPPSTSRAAAAIPQSCRAEMARFCSALEPASSQGRSAAICLKPFKSSLSLTCRRAVRGVFP